MRASTVDRLASPTTTGALDRAVRRIIAELHDGLRHGFFEFRISCEIIGQERRRLTLHAGKSHQFVIAKEEVGAVDGVDGRLP